MCCNGLIRRLGGRNIAVSWLDKSLADERADNQPRPRSLSDRQMAADDPGLRIRDVVAGPTFLFEGVILRAVELSLARWDAALIA
mmetsp:Transcript_41880/g.100635  ORF Transcript_41880/g.100635 Transcript_41880/m.100635 type:complete len:85 (-) Transcript_41880:821-1075(-)